MSTHSEEDITRGEGVIGCGIILFGLVIIFLIGAAGIWLIRH